MIFVTGASGLVGSHLIQSLLSKGKKVRALYRQAVPVFAGSEQCEWIQGDILDPIGLTDALAGVDYVYHCAAIVSFAPGAAAKMLQSNVEGTANVVNACLVQQIKKLIFVSSVAALGRIRETESIDESMHWTPATSNSVYGQSKYLAELEVWRAMEEGLPMAIVNPVIILGAGDWNNGSSGIFKSAYNEFPWYTGGMSGFVDVLDVVDAMQILMESNVVGQRYVLSAENIHYRDIFNAIAKAFDKKVSGKTTMNVALVATRSSRTDKPIKTPIQDIAKPKTKRKTNPKNTLKAPEVGLQPTKKPVKPITARTTIFKTPSPKVLPKTTADLEIGKDLKRSIKPFCISADKPTAVAANVKATVCTNIPGIRSCTYPPG